MCFHTNPTFACLTIVATQQVYTNEFKYEHLILTENVWIESSPQLQTKSSCIFTPTNSTSSKAAFNALVPACHDGAPFECNRTIQTSCAARTLPPEL